MPLNMMFVVNYTGFHLQLWQYGFRQIDGVDPSAGMLRQCKKKDIYTRLYQEFCGDKALPIEDGTTVDVKS